MTIFFTADTHFGHAKILLYCDRPFANVGEMDAELIRRWNETVGEEDVVYFLGDFCVGDPRKYARRLKGLIYFLPGSHDKEIGKLDNILPPIYTLSHIPVPIVLCHYALRSWPMSHYGSWHLYGHHHGRLEPYGLSFDVGVDGHDFYPWSIDQVAEKMAGLKPIVDYRKNK